MPIFPSESGLSISDRKSAQDLATAIEDGNVATVRHLLETWPVQPKTEAVSGDYISDLWPFKAALSGAIEKKNTELASYVLDYGLKIELYAIMLALEHRSVDMFQVLVDHGWDINMPLGQTEPPCLSYVFNDENLTRWFLAHGASPNASASALFRTPIMLAGHFAPLPIVKLLCAHATSLEDVLQSAAESDSEGRLEVIEFLLDQGADIDAIKWKHHDFSYDCFKLAYLGTALNNAIIGGFGDRVELLLRRGARVDIRNSRGQTALDAARMCSRDDIITLLARFTPKTQNL